MVGALQSGAGTGGWGWVGGGGVLSFPVMFSFLGPVLPPGDSVVRGVVRA